MTHPCGCTPHSSCDTGAILAEKACAVFQRWVADKSDRNWREHEKAQEGYKAHFEKGISDEKRIEAHQGENQKFGGEENALRSQLGIRTHDLFAG